MTSRLLTTLVLFISLQGCAVSKPNQFYRLEPPLAEVEVSGSARLNWARALGVWPVILADELDRPEVVSYRNATEVVISNRDYWAGTLRDNIDRYLVSALRHHSGEQVVRYPWVTRQKPQRQLRVRIEQFGGPLGGQVVLAAHWSLALESDPGNVLQGRVHLAQPVEGGGYNPYINALSASLDRLALDIAAALGRLE